MDHNDHPTGNDEGRIYQTETFVYTGNNGPAFLNTVRSFMNRVIHGQQQQLQQQPQQPHQQWQEGQQEQQEQPEQLQHPRNDDTEMADVDDPPIPELPAGSDDDDMPPLEPVSNDEAPPASRPMRPLPRPHAHFHAHTPGGIIDLFTFNVAGGPPPPAPPGTATFTFNLGPEALADFGAFFFGGLPKEREPDPERAKILVKGMEVVPEGLVRRLEHAGGVPGGQGNEENAGCAVCWGPLVDEVEPGEWDTTKEKEEKEKKAAENTEGTTQVDEDLRGRIVALPCAHVYHAECLLPWFSRNTTCPTCRFDVDPESLTWTPRPPTNEPPPPPPHPNDAPQHHDEASPLDIPFPPPPPPDAPPADPHTQQHQRANAAEALRLNLFINSLLRAVPLVHPRPDRPPPPNQSQPQPPAQPQSQPQPPAQPQSQPQNPSSSPVFGPPPPPPPPRHPHPPTHILPFPLPLFVLPHPNGAPNAPGANVPHGAPTFNIPRPHLHTAPTFEFPPPPSPNRHPHPHPHMHLHPHPPPPPQPGRERRTWTPPEPVGKTLRQRVEQKERELGLRCDDVVCGVAPSDEDPIPTASKTKTVSKRIKIRAAYDAHGKACEHEFHPACLVTSARVAGVNEDEEEHNSDEGGEDAVGEVQVACPRCRAEGSLIRAEWEQGVEASEAEMV